MTAGAGGKIAKRSNKAAAGGYSVSTGRREGGPERRTEVEVALPSMAVETDEALVDRARTGDVQAFGELVHRHMRRAYYAALGLVGSPDDALDLSQEAFVRAFRARTRLESGRPFYPWLYQILRRLCFNFVRDRRTRRMRTQDAAAWLVEQASARVADLRPGRSIEREEARRRVADAIATLPEHERETIVLREFEELSYKEIAELLGIPIGTVMSRLYSARRRLAAALEEGR